MSNSQNVKMKTLVAMFGIVVFCFSDRARGLAGGVGLRRGAALGVLGRGRQVSTVQCAVYTYVDTKRYGTGGDNVHRSIDSTVQT